MSKKVANYISNLGKSVAYAAVDKFGSMSPTTTQLVQSNSELFKEVTHHIINYRTTYKKSLNYFRTSKIYEAADTGITSIFEDLQSGKLWNRERIDKIQEKNMGFGEDDGFTDMDFGSSEDFGSFDNNTDISKGDEMISDIISVSSQESAQMISSTIARTSKYISDTQKTSTNVLYMQNMHAYNLFNNNLSTINDNISKVLVFNTTALQTHLENSKKFFEENTNLMQEQTALLRQIADNLSPKQEEQKQSNKITYDDIMGSGVPDIKMYMKNIKKNFGNAFGSVTSMNSMFGSDSNMLEMFMASPLQFIPRYIVEKTIPQTLEKTVDSFDKSLKGFFGSLIAKINGMKLSDNIIFNKIGEIFGISNSAKSTLDTKNYKKGKVDWDGKSRKALIEVIPGYLSKILAAVSGKAERLYDYDEGKFVDATSIKGKFKEDKKRYVTDASSEVLEKIDQYMKYITFNTVDEQKRLREDIDKILAEVYNRGGYFDLNSKNSMDYVDYGVDSKSMAIFKTMFKNMDRGTQLQLGANMVTQRDSQTKDMTAKELNADSILQSIFNNFDAGEFIDKKGNPIGGLGSNNLLKTLDNKGNNIFYYLQNIWKELIYIKRNRNPVSDDRTILYGNESYNPNDNYTFEIPDRRKNKPETKARQKYEREEQGFLSERERQLSKDSEVVNVSDISDEQQLSKKISSKIELERLKEDLNDKKNKKKSLIDKLLEAQNLTEKSKTIIEKLNEITAKPMKFIVNTIDKVDKRMYDVIFGSTKYKGQDVRGIFGIMELELTNQFAKINNFIDENILNPIKQKLNIESMKDIGQKIFGMFGLDVKELKSDIHKYFFNENDGLFSSIKKSINDVFKHAFEVSKNSLKQVYGPLFGKIKDKFKGRRNINMENSLDDLDNTDTDIVNNDNHAREIMDRVLQNERQSYYENFFGTNNIKNMDTKNKKQAMSDFIYNYTQSTDPNSEKAQLEIIKNRLDQMLERITSPGSNMSNRSENRYNYHLAEYNRRLKDYKKYNSYQNILQSLDNKTNQDKYQDMIDYKKSEYNEGLNKLIDFNDTEKTLLEKLFNNLVYGSKLDRLKFNQLLNLSNDLSKKDRRYKSVYNKLLDYSTIFSDVNKLSVDDIIENNRRKPVEQRKNARDFADSVFVNGNVEGRYPEFFGNGNSIADSIKDGIDIIKEKIVGIFDILKSKFGNNTSTNRIISSTTRLDSQLVTNPEGRATFNFAQDLTNVIANWMYNNIPHHEQGGVIENPQVATLNEGEVVLNPDNVKNLLNILNDIESGAASGKSAKKIGIAANNKVQQFIEHSKINNKEDFTKFMETAVDDKDMFNKLQQLKANKLYDKVFNIFNINLERALEEYTIKKQQFDKNGIPTDPIQRAMYNESEPLAKQVVNELYSGTVKVKDALFGTDEKQDKKKFSEAISDVAKNISKYAPEAIGGALLGGGVSLITGAIGGPLLGAAVGAGVSLTKNSEKIQNWLFGDFDNEKNERKGGVIPKNIVNKIANLAPDLESFGIAGGLTGLLPMVPFGPVGGLLIGSSIAFAKNNKKAMDFLFGENGLIDPKMQETAKKYLPRMAAGAAVGIFAGPFGILGNAALGAAGGMISSSETFNKVFFGEKDPKTGEYENGILPAVRHTIIDPLKSFMKVTGSRIQDFINDKILAPLKDAFQPIKKDVQMLLKGMFDGIGNFINKMFENSFGIPLSKFVEDKLLKPLKAFTSKMFSVLTFLPKKIISAPFAALGAVGRSRRKAHIRKGNADYMTAEERVNFRKTNKINGIFHKDKFSDFDEMLVKMTDEDKEGLLNNLSLLTTSDKDLHAKKKELTEQTGFELSKYLTAGQSKKAMQELVAGDPNLAKIYIDKQNNKNLKSTAKRQDLIKQLSNAWSDNTISPSERAKLLKDNQKKIYKTFGDYDTASKVEKMIKNGKFDDVNKLITELRDKDNTKAFDLINLVNQNSNKLHSTNKMINNHQGTVLELQEMINGIPQLKNLDLTNKRDIQKYMNLIQKEIGTKHDVDPNITPEQTVALEMDQKHHKEIIDYFKDTLEVLKKIASGNNNELNTEENLRKSNKEAYKKSFGKSLTVNNRQNKLNEMQTNLVNKKLEEIENSNLPKEVKQQAINDLMKVKAKKATLKSINNIKSLESTDARLGKFNAAIRSKYNINEKDLKSQDRFKPYYDAKDENKKQSNGSQDKITEALDNINKNDSENKNIFEKMLEKLTALVKINKDDKDIVEKIDDQGNVMKFFRNSRNDLILDKGDSGTREALAEAKDQKLTKKGIFATLSDKFKGLIDKINPANKDKEKKESFLDKILSKAKTVAGVAAGITFLPQIIKFVAPVAKELWSTTVKPFFKDEVIPWFRDKGIPFLGKTLGSSISYTLTELLPNIAKGIGNALGLSGENGEESLGGHTAKVLTRDAIQGGKGIARMSTAVAKTNPSSLPGKAVKSTAEATTSGISKLGRIVTKPFNAIDNALGINKLSEKASTKVGDKVLNKGISASEGLLKGATSQSNTIIGKLTKKIFDFMSALVNNKVFLKLSGGKRVSAEALAKPLVNWIENHSLSIAEKMSAKTAAAISTGGAINLLLAAGDFVSGYHNAANIIGITQEPTKGMRLAAGTIKALNGLLLFGLIPEPILVNLLLPPLSSIFDKDGSIQSMREQSKQEVSAWNKKNNKNLSVAQYNKEVLGKKTIKDEIKSGINTITGGVKKGAKAVGKFATNNTMLAGFNNDKVRKELGLKDDAKINMTDRISMGAAGLLDQLTFGKIDTSKSVKVINGAMITIENKAKDFWNGATTKVSNAFSSLKKGISSAAETTDKKLGSLFGMVDEKGNPVSMTQGISNKWSEFSIGVKDKWNIMKTKASETFTKIGNDLSTKFDEFKTNIVQGLEILNKKLGSLLGFEDDNGNPLSLSQGVSRGFNNVKETVSTKWNNAKTSVSNFFSNLRSKSDQNINQRNLVSGGNGPDAPIANTNILKDGGFGGSAANGMVYYSQGDPDWKANQYGSGTIGSSGCGPTSAAMVISSLTKQKVTPVETSLYSTQNGFRVPGVGTSWGFFKSIGSKYGLDFNQTTDKTAIMNALQNKQPVIFSGKGPAPFTKGGHFVVGAGLDGDSIKINDPVSLARSKPYPSSQILGNMATAFISNKALDGSIPDVSGSNSQTQTDGSQPGVFGILSGLQSTMTNTFNKIYGLDQPDQSQNGNYSQGGPTNGLVSDKIVSYIKSKEGFYPRRYIDAAGVPTIGYGSTHGPIMNKSVITEQEATDALRGELNETAAALKKDLDRKGVKLTQNEFDALVSFAYNLGINALFRSNLYNRVVSGERGGALTEEFNKFNKAGGRVLNGLVKRRSEEASIFASGSAPSYGAGGFGDNNKEILKFRNTKMKEGGFGLAPKKIEYERAGGFGAESPSIRVPYNTSDNVSLPQLRQDTTINSTLIKTIINILAKISSNTDNLNDIVQLLADVLKVKIPQTSTSENNMTKQSLANILSKNMSDSNTMDNASLLQILTALSTE